MKILDEIYYYPITLAIEVSGEGRLYLIFDLRDGGSDCVAENELVLLLKLGKLGKLMID